MAVPEVVLPPPLPPEPPAEIVPPTSGPQFSPPAPGKHLGWVNALEMPGELAPTGQVDAGLAAAVAAISPGQPTMPVAPRTPPVAAAPLAPRATAVRMPSELWLKKASADLESQPEQTRAAAFAKIMQRYRQIKAEERAWGQGNERL